MHNQQRHLKTNNIISKFAVITLSIVLLTGLALVPALQIGVHAQVQQQRRQIRGGINRRIEPDHLLIYMASYGKRKENKDKRRRNQTI